MPNIAEGARQWQKLYEQWAEAAIVARSLQSALVGRFSAFARGDGPQPTAADLAVAEEAQRRADDARSAMDEFVRSFFGK